jgi:hypothetical protein
MEGKITTDEIVYLAKHISKQSIAGVAWLFLETRSKMQ